MLEPSLCVIAQGSTEVALDAEVYRHDAAESLLISVDLPASARVIDASPARPCLGVRINLDLAGIWELLSVGAAAAPLPASPTRGIGVFSTSPPLLDAVGRLVALIDAPQDVAALAPLVHREVAYRVLTGPQGTRLRQIAASGAPASRIARAIRWLADHFAEPLRVEALAKHVGLSASAFHLHFKNVTALSPLQYQKRLRLQEARRLMLGEGVDAASASYRVGYESPSQFGREYRRLFGSSPHRDVATLRSDVRPHGNAEHDDVYSPETT